MTQEKVTTLNHSRSNQRKPLTPLDSHQRGGGSIFASAGFPTREPHRNAIGSRSIAKSKSRSIWTKRKTTIRRKKVPVPPKQASRGDSLLLAKPCTKRCVQMFTRLQMEPTLVGRVRWILSLDTREEWDKQVEGNAQTINIDLLGWGEVALFLPVVWFQIETRLQLSLVGVV